MLTFELIKIHAGHPKKLSLGKFKQTLEPCIKSLLKFASIRADTAKHIKMDIVIVEFAAGSSFSTHEVLKEVHDFLHPQHSKVTLI